MRIEGMENLGILRNQVNQFLSMLQNFKSGKLESETIECE